MRRLLACVAALLLVIGSPALALGQEASPAAEMGLPEGVSLHVLAQGVADQLPRGPAGIGLVRITLAQGANRDHA